MCNLPYFYPKEFGFLFLKTARNKGRNEPNIKVIKSEITFFLENTES